MKMLTTMTLIVQTDDNPFGPDDGSDPNIAKKYEIANVLGAPLGCGNGRPLEIRHQMPVGSTIEACYEQAGRMEKWLEETVALAISLGSRGRY